MRRKNCGGITTESFSEPLAQGIENPKDAGVLHLVLAQRDDTVNRASQAFEHSCKACILRVPGSLPNNSMRSLAASAAAGGDQISVSNIDVNCPGDRPAT